MRVFRISSKIGSFLKLIFTFVLLFVTYRVIQSEEAAEKLLEVSDNFKVHFRSSRFCKISAFVIFFQFQQPDKKPESNYENFADFDSEKSVDEKLDRAVLPKRDHSKQSSKFFFMAILAGKNFELEIAEVSTYRRQ